MIDNQKTSARAVLSILLLFFAIQSGQGQDNSYVAEPQAIFNAQMMSDVFVEIARTVGPSVVTITSQTTLITMIPSFPDLSNPFLLDPWGNFFSPPREQEYVLTGVGSGVIVSEDGLILTNHHVVGEADEVEVTLQNGHTFSGVLVGTDPATDLAVIRIESDNLPIITIGNSDSLQVGQWVLAIGSPFALSQTVTQGIVSYLGRSDVGLTDYENYIQTDAAINPGNSGGALVNLDGCLVGINTAIASRNGGYQGVGFAIPVNLAVDVMEDLLEHGYVRRGWLGVSIQELTPDLKEHFGLSEDAFGILVAQVLVDTPAREFGIQRGDVILTINGNSFGTMSQFRSMIADIEPGSRAQIGIIRDGDQQEVEVVVAEREHDVSREESLPSPQFREYGWTLKELDEATARALGNENLSGVQVIDVHSGGRVASAGIQQGDIILEIDGIEVRTPSQVEALIEASDDALILIWREGVSIYFMI